MTSRISEGPPASIFFDEKSKKKMQEKANEKIDRIVEASIKPAAHYGAEECLTYAGPFVSLMAMNASLAYTPSISAPIVVTCASVCSEPASKLIKKWAHKGIDLSIESSTKSTKKSIHYSIEKHPNKTASFCLKLFPEKC
ncbi:hypothetical protein [Parachlamydia acanthamoebae]|uniref:hypothetical protein n=1 Tax=Parachlamydia acanthamoebae TaxID=83552 RepID=UPI000751755A|nr:hypothetical protein [Parachlamydia acanthamoebae]